MTTRILSWYQVVQEADPNWQQGNIRPWVYEMSNGRRFYERSPVYQSFAITDDSGVNILDDAGQPIFADSATNAAGNSTAGFPFGTGAFGTDGF